MMFDPSNPANLPQDPARASAQIESTADAVFEGKQLLIDLDRRLNATREAVNALRKQEERRKKQQQMMTEEERKKQLPGLFKKPSVTASFTTSKSNDAYDDGKTFLLCNGGTFICFDRAVALERLDVDRKETVRSVDEAREALKEAVGELARLEGPESALAKLNQGFDLKTA